MKCSAEQLVEFSRNSEYHDLGVLPSNGIPYGDRALKVYIRAFKLAELRLLSRAVDLDEVSHLLRAVDNCVTLPVEEIAIGDFFYILLWLRMYSMPKSPYTIEGMPASVSAFMRTIRTSLLPRFAYSTR